MKLLFSATFPITPIPWQRVAIFAGRLITPKETRKYEKAVGNLAREKMGPLAAFDEPLQVDLYFSLVKPERFRRRALPDVVCDIDNLVKSTLDGMNKIVWKDDRRIVKLFAVKKWTLQSTGFFKLVVWGGVDA